MNLNSKGARRTLAATCSTAIVAVAGAAFFAAPASADVKAKSTLSVAGETAFTTLDFAKNTLTAHTAAATYAVRVTSSVGSPVYIKALTVPSGGKLSFDNEAAGAAPTPGTFADAAHKLAAGDIGASSVGNGTVYVSADTKGTYTFQLFEDVNGDNLLSATDNVSPVFTMHAVEPKANPATDEWAPAISAPTNLLVGAMTPAKVDLSGLTLTDARGSSTLGAKFAALIGIGFDSGNGTAATDKAAAVTAAGTTGNAAFGGGNVYQVDAAATTAVAAKYVAAAIDFAGDAGNVAETALTTTSTGITNPTTVIDPGTGTPGATAVTGSVVASGSGWIGSAKTGVLIRPAYGAVSYTQTGVSGSGAAGTGAMYFTATPVANSATAAGATCSGTVPTVTSDGTLVFTYGNGIRLFSVPVAKTATTASIAVTSSETNGDCSYYTLGASGAGNVSAVLAYGMSSLPSPLSIKVANDSGYLYPAVGTASVTLTASLYDQFGTAVAPLTSKSQQASLTINGATSTNTTVVVSGKVFSYTYTPTTAPASATSMSFTWHYADVAAPGQDASDSIRWTTTSDAGTVTLNSPIDAAPGVNLSTASTINPGQDASFGDTAGQVTGTVLDAGGAALSYKRVTLSGSDGVYFSSSSTGSSLAKTIDRVTDSSGQFAGAYAFFTKAGSATVTAKAGGKSDTQTVTVDDAATSDAYIISNDDAIGLSGSKIHLTGHVEDMFGNPVKNKTVTVTVSDSDLGDVVSPGTDDTDANGVFSVDFDSATAAKGDSDVIATFNAGVAPTHSSAWENVASLTKLPVGQAKDTAKLTVSPIVLTAPKTHVGQGFVQLKGKAAPNMAITIKGRTQGSVQGLVELDTVTTDKDGNFQVLEWMTDTTTFIASTGSGSSTQYSPSVTVVKIVSTPGGKARVSINTKGLGKGKVLVMANGWPDKKGTLTFYVNGKKVRTATSSTKGDLNVIISTGKGKKTIKIVFSASGYTAGSISKTITVK
jgi:hypothetical protein